MGIGIIIKICNGVLVATLCDSSNNVASPKIAEIHIFFRAMKLCTEIGLYEVQFKGDAKLVIEEVNSID